MDNENTFQSINLFEDRPPEQPRSGFFGGWTLNREALALDHSHYQIDLQRCQDAKSILDWICQIADKMWADDATLAGAVRLLNRTLRPQETGICSGGSWRKHESPTKTSARIQKQLNNHLRPLIPTSRGEWI